MRSRALLLGLLVGAPAWASSTFPTVVQTHLSLPAPLPADCALCHKNGITGLGTVVTPFGTSVRAAGAVAIDETRLKAALDAMRTSGVDSDHDGVGDIQELKNGTDPNVATAMGDGGIIDGGTGGGGGGGVVLAPPRYGCGASAVPGLVGVTGAVLLLGLRRRGVSGSR